MTSAVQCVRQMSLVDWLSASHGQACVVAVGGSESSCDFAPESLASRPWMQREGGGATARPSTIDHGQCGGARREQWGSGWVGGCWSVASGVMCCVCVCSVIVCRRCVRD